MRTGRVIIRLFIVIAWTCVGPGAVFSAFAQRDSIQFGSKFHQLHQETVKPTFNSRLEKVVNNSNRDQSPALYNLTMSLAPKGEGTVAVYERIDDQAKDLATLLVKAERETEFERDISPLTRSLIASANDSYSLLLIRRKIIESQDFELSDWLREKLLTAIGEQMNKQDKKEFSMYELPSDHKDFIKFTSVRTGNDLFTVCGLYDLFLRPKDKFIKDDRLFFQRNDDRDYTGSLLVEIGTDYLNVHGSNPSKSYQTFLYGFDVYTPYFRDTIFSADESFNPKDRPHASFQYFGWSRKVLSFNNLIRWQIAIKAGKIGGSAGAKFQNTLHQDISYSPRPRGWGAQIANGGRVGVSIEYKVERQFVKMAHRNIYPSLFFDAKLGTYMTMGGVGVQLSNKNFAKCNPNFITLYNRSKADRTLSVIRQHLMYNVAFSVNGVAHNTMLEGYGILKTNEDKNDQFTPISRHVMKSNEIRRITMLMNITLSYSTKYITYFYNWKSFSPETTMGDIGIPSPYSVQQGEPHSMNISKRWQHFAELGVSFNIL